MAKIKMADQNVRAKLKVGGGSALGIKGGKMTGKMMKLYGGMNGQMSKLFGGGAKGGTSEAGGMASQLTKLFGGSDIMKQAQSNMAKFGGENKALAQIFAAQRMNNG